MKVALVYDRVNKWGGAERVLMALHEMFPEAPLYTSVYDSQSAPWAAVFPEVVPSFLNKIPKAKRNHEILAPLMPAAFESFNFDKYDLVISVTSEAAKGILTRPSTFHICYCLTPTRYLWSAYESYFSKPISRKILKLPISYLRNWDKKAAHRPDRIIAISSAVKKRIKKYYDRDSKIIFPPSAMPLKVNSTLSLSLTDFYLVVSRLVGYKRVDLAVEVFNQLELPLVIVGVGRQEKYLKRKAKRNILFMGELTEEELALYYEKCTAVVFPQEEDFGLVAVEAQFAGRPVIALNKGGVLDTVIDRETGIFFEQQSVKSLKKAIRKFQDLKFDSQKITNNAKKFSRNRFKEDFLSLI